MDVLEIPFVKRVGVVRRADGGLALPFRESVQNHLQSVHAGAQFALAETASGDFLQVLFPDLVGRVVPLLRSSEIKFRKPASETIAAFASVSEESLSRFKAQFASKGRGSVTVGVEIRDSADVVTSSAVFTWFVQSTGDPRA